eukprot:gene57776-77109_t
MRTKTGGKVDWTDAHGSFLFAMLQDGQVTIALNSKAHGNISWIVRFFRIISSDTHPTIKPPLEEPQGGTSGSASDRLTGQPQERQHSDGASRDAGPTAPDASGRIRLTAHGPGCAGPHGCSAAVPRGHP